MAGGASASSEMPKPKFTGVPGDNECYDNMIRGEFKCDDKNHINGTPEVKRLYIDPEIQRDEHFVLLMQYVCKTARACHRTKKPQGRARLGRAAWHAQGGSALPKGTHSDAENDDNQNNLSSSNLGASNPSTTKLDVNSIGNRRPPRHVDERLQKLDSAARHRAWCENFKKKWENPTVQKAMNKCMRCALMTHSCICDKVAEEAALTKAEFVHKVVVFMHIKE